MAGWPVRKNDASGFTMVFPLFDADGDLVTGGAGDTPDSEVSKDGGTFTDCTNEFTELATSSGMYQLVLTQAEINADRVAVISKTATATTKTAPNVIYTSTRNIDDLCFPTTSGRSTDVTTGGAVGIDWANVEGQATAVDLSATDIQLVDTCTTNTDVTALNDIAAGDVWAVDATTQQTQGTFGQAIGDPVADTTTIYQSVATDATGDNVAVDVNAVKAETALIVADTNELQTDDYPASFATAQSDLDTITGTNGVLVDDAAITAAKFAANAIDANAVAADAIDLIWNEAESGHTTAGTYGNNLRVKHLTMTIGQVNDAGATTTDFDTSGFTEATDDHFNEHMLIMTSGANKGQGRRIRDYTGTGQNVVFDRPWTAAPANTDTFIILGMPSDAGEALYARPADFESDWNTSVRRVGWMIAKNTNRVDASTTTVAIKKTDDSTNQFTQTATENGSAVPIEVLDTD
jgi:hypothetical protein